MKKYGILIGRLQPIHLAHQSIINEIMQDGRTPIIFLGSSNAPRDERNPLSYVERSTLVHDIYGRCVVTLPLPDNESDDKWVNHITRSIYSMGIDPSDCEVFYYKKSDDLHDIRPLLWMFNFREVTYPHIYGEISASNIRSNLDTYKKYIDGRVHNLLKEWGY